jgi:hypothetical protein
MGAALVATPFLVTEAAAAPAPSPITVLVSGLNNPANCR